MAASRFECPRCQTVFVKDIGDAAFVDCPSCGAIALPSGDATEGVLVGSLGGDVPGRRPGRVARPKSDQESDPNATELEQRAVSDPPRMSSDSAPPSTPGIFAGLLDDDDRVPAAGSPPSSLAAHTDPGVDASRSGDLHFDFGPGADIDIDMPDPPPGGATIVTRRPDGLSDPSGSGRSRENPSNPFGAPALDAPPVNTLPAQALARLAADAEAGPTDANRPTWSVSEEAFGALERAFDEMALKPVARSPRDGLNDTERDFLRRERPDPASVPPPRPPPIRKPDRARAGGAPPLPPRPPPRSGPKGKRPRPARLELSAEARSLAFLPLRVEGSGAVARPPPLDEGVDIDLDSSAPSPRPPPPPPPPLTSGPPVGATPEITDVVRGGRDRPRKKPPSPLEGLTMPRVAALALVALLIGGAAGALTVPPKPPPTARVRAELRFADGNRFYDGGRYDDALGAFREALQLDSTYAIAARAKGAALAKLGRYDDAAAAYSDYLAATPGAPDATDTMASITRRGLTPKASAAPGAAEPPPASPPPAPASPPPPAAPPAGTPP